MEAVLAAAGLSYLSPNFLRNKIKIEHIQNLNSNELEQLGVNTIGDRIRLRDTVNDALKGLVCPIFQTEMIQIRQNMLTKFVHDPLDNIRIQRPTNIGSILQFTTGADEEPALGFAIQPSIVFSEAKSFIPTANTCINRINLAIPHELQEMPSNDELFKSFDMAFSNTYFGLQ